MIGLDDHDDELEDFCDICEEFEGECICVLYE